jgi:hypothetical protein
MLRNEVQMLAQDVAAADPLAIQVFEQVELAEPGPLMLAFVGAVHE